LTNKTIDKTSIWLRFLPFKLISKARILISSLICWWRKKGGGVVLRSLKHTDVKRKCLRMKNSYYSNILIYLSKFKWNNTNLKSNFWFEKEKKKFCLTTTIILTKILLKVALNTINQPKFLTLDSWIMEIYLDYITAYLLRFRKILCNVRMKGLLGNMLVTTRWYSNRKEDIASSQHCQYHPFCSVITFFLGADTNMFLNFINKIHVTQCMYHFNCNM
jgi:hypothetical protein